MIMPTVEFQDEQILMLGFWLLVMCGLCGLAEACMKVSSWIVRRRARALRGRRLPPVIPFGKGTPR